MLVSGITTTLCFIPIKLFVSITFIANHTKCCAVMAQKPQRYEYQDQLRSTQQDGAFIVYDKENGKAWVSAEATVEIKE
jgi:hypothetical protein